VVVVKISFNMWHSPEKLTPSSRVLNEKLIVAQIVKKLTAFCQTRIFITRVYKSSPLVPGLSLMNSVHTLTPFVGYSLILTIHLCFSKWSLPFKCSEQNSVCMFYLYRSRGPGFDSRGFQIFWEAACLEQDPLSFVRTTEELLGRKSSGSGLENRN
jgi:hypothetical protein